ncbi:hypothetical protein [Lentzea albida]|uniref:Uncharacterized protein n=1 Tax=Lentzea albida TaxID=65499 RepID=A0A1H9H1W2_9PSEU|nr:hypothetical protein [Lentzea albida]SEQ56253.1 hypothetical protein SAMN04488000_103360 [Lentzea albida]
MTSTLPPPRDLPPGRHTQIRAELEQAVAGRRLLFPVLAGVAAVAAVVVSVVTLRPVALPPEPAVPVTSPPPTTSGPDVPRATAEAIEKGCMHASGQIGKAELRQLFDEQTRWALLHDEQGVLLCALGEGARPYTSDYARRAVRLLPGHLSVDVTTATSGGDHRGTWFEGKPGHRTVAGRIDPAVARVSVTADGVTADAKIVNGTYAVRLYHPPSWTVPEGAPEPLVRAYDASGEVLGTSQDERTACFYDPKTLEIVYGDPLLRDQCRPASPWR